MIVNGLGWLLIRIVICFCFAFVCLFLLLLVLLVFFWLYSQWWLFNRFSIPGSESSCYFWFFHDQLNHTSPMSSVFNIWTTKDQQDSQIPDCRDATEQIIHSFITSRLNNNNALLYGLQANQLYRLQKIQNTAARILTFSRKSCHITPILMELHWLSVTRRIVFKLLIVVYKCTNNIAPSFLFIWTPLGLEHSLRVDMYLIVIIIILLLVL